MYNSLMGIQLTFSLFHMRKAVYTFLPKRPLLDDDVVETQEFLFL